MSMVRIERGVVNDLREKRCGRAICEGCFPRPDVFFPLIPPPHKGRVLGCEGCFSRSDAFFPSSPLPPSPTGREGRVGASGCLFLPSSPPTPFSHKGRRGSQGILMPEASDATRRRA